MIKRNLIKSGTIGAIIALAVISLISTMTMGCNETKTASGEADSDTVSTELPSNDELLLYDKRPVPASADANFEDFFYTFLTDGEFLESRVQYPFQLDDNGKQKTLKKGEWKDKERMQSQELFVFLYEEDGDLKLIKDTIQHDVDIVWVDLNNYSSDRYDFALTDGKWMLTKQVRSAQPEEKYKEFLEFYSHFAADANFQRECLTNPVLLTISSEGEMDEGGTAELIPEEWSEFHSEMPMPEGVIALMDYGQTFGDATVVNMMVRSISQPLFATYKFRRIAGRWTLFAVEY